MRRIIDSWKLLSVLSVLVLTTACSVANYKRPITDFATATLNAEKALVLLDEDVTEAYSKMLHAQIIDGEKLLEVRREDGRVECQLTSERCRLIAKTRGGDIELAPPEPLLGNLVILMGGISTYAENLVAIVNAETATEVVSQVNATLGSVENLAKTVDKLRESDMAESVTDYKTSLGKAANWLVGQYVAKVQLDGLRQATSAANPVIARTADIAEETATIAADHTNHELVNSFDAAFSTFEGNQSKSNLNTLFAKADAYDRVLMAKPASVYGQLRTAHEALTKKLNNEDLRLVDVMAKIETFAKESKALKEIVDDIRTVNNN